MSSIDIFSQNSGLRARYNKRYQDYTDNLALQNLLETAYAVGNRAAAKAKMGGYKVQPTSVTDYKNAEARIADMTGQQAQAIKNVREVFKHSDDVGAFVNALSVQIFPGTNLTEVALFNRYWPAFKGGIFKNISPESITPEYLFQLWQRYKATIAFLEKRSGVIDFVNPSEKVLFRKQLEQQVEIILSKIPDEEIELKTKARQRLNEAIEDLNFALIQEASRVVDQHPYEFQGLIESRPARVPEAPLLRARPSGKPSPTVVSTPGAYRTKKSRDYNKSLELLPEPIYEEIATEPPAITSYRKHKPISQKQRDIFKQLEEEGMFDSSPPELEQYNDSKRLIIDDFKQMVTEILGVQREDWKSDSDLVEAAGLVSDELRTTIGDVLFERIKSFYYGVKKRDANILSDFEVEDLFISGIIVAMMLRDNEEINLRSFDLKKVYNYHTIEQLLNPRPHPQSQEESIFGQGFHRRVVKKKLSRKEEILLGERLSGNDNKKIAQKIKKFSRYR